MLVVIMPLGLGRIKIDYIVVQYQFETTKNGHTAIVYIYTICIVLRYKVRIGYIISVIKEILESI